MDFNIDEQYKLLKRAFTMLRRKGYTGKTRTNVSNERMVDDYTQLKKHIVFNWNNYNTALKSGILRLQWSGNGAEIVEALKAEGLTVRWDNRTGTKIQVIFFNFVAAKDVKYKIEEAQYKAEILRKMLRTYESEIGNKYDDVLAYRDTAALRELLIGQRKNILNKVALLNEKLEVLKDIKNEGS